MGTVCEKSRVRKARASKSGEYSGRKANAHPGSGMAPLLCGRELSQEETGAQSCDGTDRESIGRKGLLGGGQRNRGPGAVERRTNGGASKGGKSSRWRRKEPPRDSERTDGEGTLYCNLMNGLTDTNYFLWDLDRRARNRIRSREEKEAGGGKSGKLETMTAIVRNARTIAPKRDT